jgi:hypothetical protein
MMPKISIIEATAAELAATMYEVGRSQGLQSKYKTHKAYAKAYWENYIPIAIDTLLSMLNRPDLPDNMKEEIYDAIQERNNDERMKPLNGQIPELKECLVEKVKFEVAFKEAMKSSKVESFLNNQIINHMPKALL